MCRIECPDLGAVPAGWLMGWSGEYCYVYVCRQSRCWGSILCRIMEIGVRDFPTMLEIVVLSVMVMCMWLSNLKAFLLATR